MTLNPPAEPRPPPLRRPPDAHRSALSGPTTKTHTPIERRTPSLLKKNDQHEDGRPAKRRKIEGDSTTSQASSVSNETPVAQSPGSFHDPNVPRLRLVKSVVLNTDDHSGQGQQEGDDGYGDEVPELPARPWSHVQQSRKPEDPKPTHRSRVKIPVPNTPDSLRLPSSAPYIVSKKPAGFFPWTGKHPEDVLSESNVKQGFYDKPPNPPEKELNTAKGPLYNVFKHKAGVENLSLLFSFVLERKNRHGLIRSASTFRPPPRVTLTEAKRKSWIADLANADVPLRRLSRTIPQGIRGQVLLDQCLQGSVPLNRAIWFAKCVCANEIRTLKRKGTTPAIAVGTESKWLREWTVSVEQFVATHLEQTKRQEWRSNIEYALRLTSRLYMENLLDRDHYLDWILRSFHSADLAHTPFWLMVIHIYKEDLSYYRKRGRKLAEALADKYQLVRKPSALNTTSLRQKLRHTIRWLILAWPKCFLMPEKWPQIVDSIRACLDATSQHETQLLERLDFINARTMGQNKQAFTTKHTAREMVVEILDSTHNSYDLSKLDEQLSAACDDTTRLISTCLEWVCTRFRHSRSRIYLFARLARRWQRMGHDIDNIILNYLSDCRNGCYADTVDQKALQHLAAQLSRSGLFPLAKYMQWLMVRGLPQKGALGSGLDSISDDLEHQADPSRLLLHVSLHNVKDHVINLRNSVLRGCGFSPESEDNVFQDCVQYIEQELASLAPGRKPSQARKPEPAFSSVPWTVKSRLSMWLRSKIAEWAHAIGNAPGGSAAPALPGSRVFNVEQFALVRKVLELMEDDAVLADVIGLLSSSPDEDVIASLVATIHFHADVFSAIGAFEVLQHRMCQVYLTWRTSRPTMPLFTSTLLDLCTTYPVKAPTTRLLQQDFVKGDRGRAVAACSPYSDGIAESLQQAGATFVEDFEAILQSEPNMSEQTMNGLFAVLVDRIEKQQNFGYDSETVVSFCHLLSRLRLCRRVQGDLLIQKWVARLTPSVDGNFGALLLQSLVGADCTTFVGLFGVLPESNSGVWKSSAARILLQHIGLPPEGLLPDLVEYRARSRWLEYVQEYPRSALEILCEIGLESALAPIEKTLLSCLVNDDTFRTSTLSRAAQQWLLAALDRLLFRGAADKTGDMRALIGSMNVFSHRFVQLRFWLASRIMPDQSTGYDQDEFVQVLSKMLGRMLQEPPGHEEGHRWFAQLLESVDVGVANQLRHQVESEFLEALPKFLPNKAASPVTAVFSSDVHHLSSIIERAYLLCTSTTSPLPGFMAQLVDKLTQHLKALGVNPLAPASSTAAGPSPSPMNTSAQQMMAPTYSPAAGSSEAGYGVMSGMIMGHFRYLLQMVCLQRLALCSAVAPGANAKQVQTEQAQLLVRLASIATHPAIDAAATDSADQEDQHKVKEVLDFTFDVMATIIDNVGDEVRMIGAKALKDKLQDMRIRHLFGSVNLMGSTQVRDVGQGLQMIKEGKGVLGDWKPRVWEILDNGSAKESETSLGLGLFGARHK
ncbi:Mediator of RNA polymerase II transcription subunit 12 [Exophiala dermatitidis]